MGTRHKLQRLHKDPQLNVHRIFVDYSPHHEQFYIMGHLPEHMVTSIEEMLVENPLPIGMRIDKS